MSGFVKHDQKVCLVLSVLIKVRRSSPPITRPHSDRKPGNSDPVRDLGLRSNSCIAHAVCLFYRPFICILSLDSLDSLQAAGFVKSPDPDDQMRGISSSPSLTTATSPIHPKPSLNNQESSSVVNDTSDDNSEPLESSDFVVLPKVEAVESTAPIVAESAPLEPAPSRSKAVDGESKVNTNSMIVGRSPDCDISRPHSLPLSEQYKPQPSPSSSAPQRRSASPFFLTPHPGGDRSQQATDKSLWRTMTVHEGESASSTEQLPQDDSAKRPHSRIGDESSVPGSTFLDDSGQVTLKRRKKDVDAFRIKVAELQKKRDEAKRVREEAKRKAEEHRVGHLPKTDPKLS